MHSWFDRHRASFPATETRPRHRVLNRGVLLATVLLAAAALVGAPRAADAQEPFLGEIRMFAGNFAPRGWALCEGQLLDINTNQALFSILGTTYGGDGRTNFALPDLRGRVPLHGGFSTGPGLSLRRLGESGGSEETVLSIDQMPSHRHGLRGSDANGAATSPVGMVPARNAAGVPVYGPPTADHQAGDAIDLAGGSAPHDNMQPYLGVTFIIALQGIYPSRN